MTALQSSVLEADIRRIGREIFARARAAVPRPLTMAWWQQLGIEWTAERPHLRARLFRFISEMPQLPTDAAVADRLRSHLRQNGDDLPWPLSAAVDFEDERSLPARMVGKAARLASRQMARSFIVGSTPAEAIAAVQAMRRRGMAFTLDILGESVGSDAAAADFHRRYLALLAALGPAVAAWPAAAPIDTAPFGPLPRANVSIKLSALSTHFRPEAGAVDPRESAGRLREICRAARRGGAFINVDMEHYALRDETIALFMQVLGDAEFRDWPDAGIVVQAYLRDSRGDVDRLLAWARRRATPITVRLVKGAYWDYETALATRQGRPSPVWSDKWESDANFEELSTVMLENAAVLRPAYGSHNVRSIAHTLATADALGLPARTVELQMLFGMGDPLKAAVVALGQRLRVYAPMGEWVPGVAYLVRRLIENTANESFLRQTFADDADEAGLLAPPARLAKGHAALAE